MFNKNGESFGTIIAVFGSILITLGIAWLIAQNWHQISSPIKIIILLGATSLAYIVGTIMRVKNYSGIGKAFLILGALLYTLSIFLIAQIFSTSVSWQGQAWLWLLAWVGVVASAYIFDSSANLVVGLIEICLWLVIQFIAFADRTYNQSYGILALYFLAMGILLYGLALLHSSAKHKFGKVYLVWTAFYFMAFNYVLSFQILLPLLWANGLDFSSAIVFLLFLSVISIIALVLGIILSLNKQTAQSKEIIGVFALVILLILLIASASFVSVSVGRCYQKECYDFKEQESCTNSNLQIGCKWGNNLCITQTQECPIYKDENSCTQNNCKWSPVTRCEQKNCKKYTGQEVCETSEGCKWTGTSCIEKESCSQFNTQNSCENLDNLNCEWLNNLCTPIQQYCYNYRTENSCKKADCEWVITGQCYNTVLSQRCYEYSDESSCESAKGCDWKNTYCDVKRTCEQLTNKEGCSQHTECKWLHTSYSGFGRKGEIPLSLWAIWIFANVIFILLIIGIIGYGTWQKIPKMINLGTTFFSLDILTRYIGFAMNFWGYTSLSIIFTSGGIMLLVGGFFIERWRKKLVAQVKNSNTNKTK